MSTPPVKKGGGSWGPNSESALPNDFCAKMRTTDEHDEVIQQNQNTAKTRKSDKQLQNDAQKTNFEQNNISHQK